MLTRIRQQLAMRKRAAKFGFRFIRRASFELPEFIRLKDGRCLLSLPSEPGVYNDFVAIFLEDCYRLSSMQSGVSSVLDIGANVGLFGLAARGYFPEAVIHSYEPNRGLEKPLQSHSSDAGFEVYWEAVGSSHGFIALEDRGDSNQARSRDDPNGSVPQVPLDLAVKRLGGKVDLAKVDCEGAEWSMFDDAEGWKGIHFLAMEYHLWPDHSHQEVAERVDSLGFDVVAQAPGSDFGLIWGRRCGRAGGPAGLI